MLSLICFFFRHKDIILPEDSIINSSATARDFIAFFSKRVFDICLSSSTPWTLEKWHIKASLRQVDFNTPCSYKIWLLWLSRKHKVWVKEDQIEIPGEKFGSIEGPDLSLENKEFVAILNINNLEKVSTQHFIIPTFHFLCFSFSMHLFEQWHRSWRSDAVFIILTWMIKYQRWTLRKLLTSLCFDYIITRWIGGTWEQQNQYGRRKEGIT